MKEIGTLIELLNEYVEETDFGDNLDEYNEAEILDEETLEVNGKYHDIEYLYTKKFGFIKWLVENDKIDRDKCGFKNEGLSGNWYDSGIAFVQNYDNDTYKVSEFYSPYLQLLMLLSISSSPIEDLISYLK